METRKKVGAAALWPLRAAYITVLTAVMLVVGLAMLVATTAEVCNEDDGGPHP